MIKIVCYAIGFFLITLLFRICCIELEKMETVVNVQSG